MISWKKPIVAFVTGLTLVVAAGAYAADGLEAVKKRGVLVVGVTDNAPPFSYRDRGTGRLLGYDLDYLAEIADVLGVGLEPRVLAESNRLDALLEGRIDLLAGALTHSPSREMVVAFTDHYLVTGQKFLARRGTIRSLADVAGKKVGAIVGTASELCARDRCEGGTIVPFDDYIQGIQALREGVIDAFTSDEAILADLLVRLPRGDYEIPDVLLSKEEYHFAVRKEDTALLEAVDRAIARIEDDGRARALRSEWFATGEDLPPPAYGAILRRAAAGSRFLGIGLSGLFYPDTEVSIYAIDGNYLGKGRLASVVGDEFYVDVGATMANLIRPGFLVTRNMTEQMALDILVRRRNLLRNVEQQSQKLREEVRAESSREAAAKEKRAREMDTVRERTRVSVQRERAVYFRGYGYRGYRGHRGH